MNRLTLDVLLKLAVLALVACVIANTVYFMATGR